MWPLVLKILEVTLVIGGAIASALAARMWLQAQKHRSVAEAKDEVIKLLSDNADAWKSRYEAEHLEHNEYQKRQHDRNNESNAKILHLTDVNASLKAKTDLSPIMEALAGFIADQREFMKNFTEINGKILTALTNLEQRINASPARTGRKRAAKKS